jgi:hypothetical protein
VEYERKDISQSIRFLLFIKRWNWGKSQCYSEFEVEFNEQKFAQMLHFVRKDLKLR